MQTFINGIELPWIAAVKAYIGGSDSHKNNFAKMISYFGEICEAQ